MNANAAALAAGIWRIHQCDGTRIPTDVLSGGLSVKLLWTVNQQPKQNERKVVNDEFDELAKGLAQSVTRRGALKKFSVSLAGIALASLGLVNTTHAADNPKRGTKFRCKCSKSGYGCERYGPDDFWLCIAVCDVRCSPG